MDGSDSPPWERKLKIESANYYPRSRGSSHASRIDVSKAGNRLASSRVSGLRGFGVGRRRIIHVGAVEHVLEIYPEIQRDSFLEPEVPPETHALPVSALLPVVVVIRGPGAELSGKRIGPSVRIQDEILVRVDAVAIGVFREKRLARNAVGKGVLEKYRAELALRDRGLNRHAACILQHYAVGPISNYPRQDFVPTHLGSRVVQRGYGSEGPGEH